MVAIEEFDLYEALIYHSPSATFAPSS